jgi:hypothetical protein
MLPIEVEFPATRVITIAMRTRLIIEMKRRMPLIAWEGAHIAMKWFRRMPVKLLQSDGPGGNNEICATIVTRAVVPTNVNIDAE